jgi:hypothetical protein
VLVLHGGLFYTEGVTLQDLSEIDRLEYVVPSKNEDMIDEVSRLLHYYMNCTLHKHTLVRSDQPHSALKRYL